jgi:O-acetyl-ADP-ribose deacetylase (regulator of RNase III)
LYIKKNILTVNNGIICHQVNCKCKMGAGIALKIRKKWPIVYEQYLSECMLGKIQLGSVQIIKINPVLYVANLAGQDGYGRDKRYTNYAALLSCFFDLQKISDELNLQIYIPYKIGCSNAGGDWNIVENDINRAIINPVICKP